MKIISNQVEIPFSLTTSPDLSDKILLELDSKTYNPILIEDREIVLNKLGLNNIERSDAISRQYSQEANTNYSSTLNNSFFEVKFTAWKLIASISSKVIEYNDESITLDCLISRDPIKYEEREFNRNLFADFEISEGRLFKLCYYERYRQSMLEVKDGNNLVMDNDFPDIDFYQEFKDIKLKSRP